MSRLLSLEFLSITYLSLPYLLFYAGWLRPAIFAPLFLLFISTFYIVVKGLPKSKITVSFSMILVMSLLFIWVLLSGVGQVGGYQNYDYKKHNAVLNDLTTQKWPVRYQKYEDKPYLTYYFAYYLPASFVGEINPSWKLPFHFLFTATGIFLGFLWFCRLSPNK